MSYDLKLSFNWVKAHQGVIGNTVADFLEKQNNNIKPLKQKSMSNQQAKNAIRNFVNLQ